MKQIFEFIIQPWPWFVAGPLIGLTVPTLLLIGNKSFGISSSLRNICAACFPVDITFFKYDWKKEIWNLIFVLGVFFGGVLATNFLENPNTIVISEATISDLKALGYSLEDFPATVQAQAMYQIQYYWIQNRGSASFFGYTLALECLAEQCGPELAA